MQSRQQHLFVDAKQSRDIGKGIGSADICRIVLAGKRTAVVARRIPIRCCRPDAGQLRQPDAAQQHGENNDRDKFLP